MSRRQTGTERSYVIKGKKPVLLSSSSEEEPSSESSYDDIPTQEEREAIMEMRRYIPATKTKNQPKPAAEAYRKPSLNLLHKFLTHDSIVSDYNEYFNYWTEYELRQQVLARKLVFRTNTPLGEKLVELRFQSVFVDVPYLNNLDRRRLYPFEALKEGIDYSAAVKATPCLYLAGSPDIKPIDKGEQMDLFTVLIPVLSMHCNLSMLDTDVERHEKNHDPSDPGTWFIVGGNKMVMPSVEHLRLCQIFVQEPGVKNDTIARAVQYFVTETSSVMMKVVRNTGARGDVMLAINAFGEQTNAKGEVKKQYKNNAINVIHVAALINAFYKINKDDKRSEKPMDQLMLDYIKIFAPRPKGVPYAVEKVVGAFMGTIEMFRKKSMQSVITELMVWKKMTGFSDKKVANTIRQMIVRDIFPTAFTRNQKIAMLANLTARLFILSPVVKVLVVV